MQEILDKAYKNYMHSEFVVATLYKKADYSKDGDKEFYDACELRNDLHDIWCNLMALNNKMMEKELFSIE